jgi:hypothetical protein
MANVSLQTQLDQGTLEALLVSMLEQRLQDSSGTMEFYALLDASKPALMDDMQTQLAPYRREPIKPTNLYDDLGNNELATIGPRLLALQTSRKAVSSACRAAFNSFGLSLLVGISGTAMEKHLRELREITLPDGAHALFRYQDTRVASALLPLLEPDQAVCMLGAINAWFTPHICGQASGWHYHQPTSNHKSPPLRITQQQLDALNQTLFVNTVEQQTNETDTSLLAGKSPCAITTLLQQRIQQAINIGLTSQRDLSLFAILSLQLPQGFEKKPPFNQAFEDAIKQCSTLAQALEKIPPAQWQTFERH